MKLLDVTGMRLAHTEKSCVSTGSVEIKSKAFSSLEVNLTPFVWPFQQQDSGGSWNISLWDYRSRPDHTGPDRTRLVLTRAAPPPAPHTHLVATYLPFSLSFHLLTRFLNLDEVYKLLKDK